MSNTRSADGSAARTGAQVAKTISRDSRRVIANGSRRKEADYRLRATSRDVTWTEVRLAAAFTPRVRHSGDGPPPLAPRAVARRRLRPRPRRAPPQPEGRRRRPAARRARRLHGGLGLGQVVARVRHDLRRGAAALSR